MEHAGNSSTSSIEDMTSHKQRWEYSAPDQDQKQRQVDDILQHQQTVLAEMRENLKKLRCFKHRLLGTNEEGAKSPKKEKERVPDSVAGKLQNTMEDMYQTQTEIREVIHALEGFA